ncbi:MAG: phosphatidate cytidylyltransferase [Acidimicrobiales bacterium]
MTDQHSGFDDEDFRVADADPVDDDVVPGRSVFGDDDESFDDDDAAVPHWSEPATGAVPQVGGSADSVTFAPPAEPALIEANDDDMAAWADVSSTPRWADEEPLMPPTQPLVEDSADIADDFFAFDDSQAAKTAEPSLGAALNATRGGGESDRDLPVAVMVGVGLAALILAAMTVGPAAALAVVTLALGLAAVEFFNAVRIAGHQPAVLLGLTASVMMPLAVYWRGEQAMVLVVVLSIVFGSLWYLTGVGNESAVRGLGTTLLGIIHIGLLGSFAALMLGTTVGGVDVGTGLLTAAVLVTVGYDVGALAIGKVMGRTPLSPASPNKTMEGLVGGMVVAVAVGVIMGIMGKPAPFAGEVWGGGFGASLLLGLVAALAAPIGDLAESQIKRDLGIKDMGSILPGHGGLLDRFDGLLFVLPATYYVAVLMDVVSPG